jgi:hypothetical protein
VEQPDLEDLMNLWIALVANLIGIALLAYALYFRRYHRRDLLLSYVALNVGIFAVSALLVDASVGAGLGLGLFGILSILRLRSDQITQEEVAYYFMALAMGLVNGLHLGAAWVSPALTAVLVGVMWAVDHPRLGTRTYRQTVTLDTAYPDRDDLRAALAQLLRAEVRHLVVLELDLVRDVTVVDVRYHLVARRHPVTAVRVPAARGAA